MSIEEMFANLTEALGSLEDTIQAHTEALNTLKATTRIPASTPAPAAAPAPAASDAMPAPARRGRRSRAEIEAAEKAAAAAKDAPAAEAGITEAEIREEFADFLAYGEDTSKSDMAERDRRTAFVISICDHFATDDFPCEGVKDIPPEHRQTALNWMNRYQLGETTIDFENDKGESASEREATRAATTVAKKRSLV
jgi:uncharacterized protein YciI